MEYVIREANIPDCDKLTDLMGQLGYPTTSDKILEQINFYKNNNAYKIFVLECENKVVAAISIALIEYFHRKAKFMRITSLVVDAEHRRKGLGKKLLEYIENFANQENCEFIELTTGTHRIKLGSHDFYKSLGYEDIYEKKRYLAKKLVSQTRY